MPSVTSTFVAGLLLGAGASWGGGALLAPMDGPGLARAEGLDLEPSPSGDVDRTACETLAGMLRAGTDGRAPRSPAGQTPQPRAGIAQ